MHEISNANLLVDYHTVHKTSNSVNSLLYFQMGITPSLPDQKQKLHDACRTGDLQTLELLIENKVNMNQFDKNKSTPLHLAVSKGHVEIAQLLLENGAGVDIREGEIGPTALMNAAFHGEKEIFSLLIEFGADIRLKDLGKRTALHHAAVNGHDELVQIILDKGLDVDDQDHTNSSPLHLAAVSGKTSTAKILISKGAGSELEGLNNTTHTWASVKESKGYPPQKNFRFRIPPSGRGLFGKIFLPFGKF